MPTVESVQPSKGRTRIRIYVGKARGAAGSAVGGEVVCASGTREWPIQPWAERAPVSFGSKSIVWTSVPVSKSNTPSTYGGPTRAAASITGRAVCSRAPSPELAWHTRPREPYGNTSRRMTEGIPIPSVRFPNPLPERASVTVTANSRRPVPTQFHESAVALLQTQSASHGGILRSTSGVRTSLV